MPRLGCEWTMRLPRWCAISSSTIGAQLGWRRKSTVRYKRGYGGPAADWQGRWQIAASFYSDSPSLATNASASWLANNSGVVEWNGDRSVPGLSIAPAIPDRLVSTLCDGRFLASLGALYQLRMRQTGAGSSKQDWKQRVNGDAHWRELHWIPGAGAISRIDVSACNAGAWNLITGKSRAKGHARLDTLWSARQRLLRKAGTPVGLARAYLGATATLRRLRLHLVRNALRAATALIGVRVCWKGKERA